MRHIDLMKLLVLLRSPRMDLLTAKKHQHLNKNRAAILWPRNENVVDRMSREEPLFAH